MTDTYTMKIQKHYSKLLQELDDRQRKLDNDRLQAIQKLDDQIGDEQARDRYFRSGPDDIQS